jgi:hypothetical protein
VKREPLDWFGAEGGRLISAFASKFGVKPRPFGTRATVVGGVSDNAEGVQWNASYDPRDRRQWAGVNLEGMKYEGWPVARLIRRETLNPMLPGLARKVQDPETVEVRWIRDYWQASARPVIVEATIAPTPLSLGLLTEGQWKQALEGAHQCFDSREGLRRAKQRVTLAAGGRQIEGEVSPHLTITVSSERYAPWDEFLATARERLEVIYQWALDRSR